MANCPKCGGHGYIYAYGCAVVNCWDCDCKETCPKCGGTGRKNDMSTTVNVQVSIPVKVGGYTGQRDQWEEFEPQFSVKCDGSNVVLEDTTRSLGRRITFNIDDLHQAIDFWKRNQNIR